MKFANIDPATPLGEHFTFAEFLAGHSPSRLDAIDWKPECILPVITVAEMARDRYQALILDIADDEIRKNHPHGISVSSGLRLRGSARAPKSKHIYGEACDFRPSGNWKACHIARTPALVYDAFYGCFVWALSHFEEPFGLGYYPDGRSGIHVDAGFDTRDMQNRRDGLLKNHGIHGWRWSHKYSLKLDSKKLLALDKKFAVHVDREPWEHWAKLYGVNINFPK